MLSQIIFLLGWVKLKLFSVLATKKYWSKHKIYTEWISKYKLWKIDEFMLQFIHGYQLNKLRHVDSAFQRVSAPWPIAFFPCPDWSRPPATMAVPCPPHVTPLPNHNLCLRTSPSPSHSYIPLHHHRHALPWRSAAHKQRDKLKLISPSPTIECPSLPCSLSVSWPVPFPELPLF